MVLSKRTVVELMSTEVDHHALRQRWGNFLVFVVVIVNRPVPVLVTPGQYSVTGVSGLPCLRRSPTCAAGPVPFRRSLRIF